MKVFGIFVVVVVVCQAALSAGKSTAVKPDVPVKNVGGKIIQNSGIQALNIISGLGCDDCGRPDEEEPVEVKPAEEEEEEEPEETVKIPDGYEVIDGVGAYKLYNEDKTWNEASASCNLDGGYLAIPDSDETFNAITKIRGTVKESWIGISSPSSDGKWVTVLGEPITPHKFLNGEPNGNGKENCLTSKLNGFNDFVCTNKIPYVCEFPITKNE